MSSSGNKVELADGRWVVLRPLRGRDLIAMVRGTEEILERMAAAVVEQSWEGDILEEEFDILRTVIAGWKARSEDAVVPPGSGESSR